MNTHRTPLKERFWPKLDKRGPDECWPWIAYVNGPGYGCINHGGRGHPTLLAHRVSWELANGSIPAGMHVLQRCDNPPCCNPAHLFLGTAKENMRDMCAKGRGNKPKGEAHRLAKITDEIVRKIRKAYLAENISHRALAARYGVSHPVIGEVLRGKSWKHVA